MTFAADAMGLLLTAVARLVTGAQGHWHGCPPKAEQRIYFANHQSHLDWVLIWAALPRDLRAQTRPIAAKDYWQSGRFKHWLTREVFNAVYVDRGGDRGPASKPGATPPSADGSAPLDPGSAPTDTTVAVRDDATGSAASSASAVPPPLQATAASAPPPALDASPDGPDPLGPLAEALHHGDSLVIFPEGTRGHQGDPQPFKSGLYHLARQFPQATLVPAWIDNVQRVMPKGEVVPVPILCSVTFGAPIEAPRPGEDKRDFLERARAAVLALKAVAA
jgi:1-acyl-sn-glycerol-3-phosphate acyltransferase